MSWKSIGLVRIAESKITHPGWSWCQHLAALLPILSVYLALAFYRIGNQSLWEDEFLSVERLASSIPLWKDGHGFLYFVLLRWWMQAGTSEVVLRSFSSLLGAVAVCLIYVLSATLFNRRMAVMGTVLFATSPFLIWYSQEARYITLMLMTTLLMMYTFQGVIARDRLGWWLAYGSTTLLAFFSFLSTLLLPVAHGLYLLWSPSHRLLLRKWVVCQMLVFALFGWWFANGTHYWKAFVEARSSSQQTLFDPKGIPTGDFNKITPAVIPYTFFAFSTGFSLGPSPRELHADRSLTPLVPYASLLCILTALYGGLVLVGLIVLWQQREVGRFLMVWIGIPIIGAFGIAALTNMFYDVRYVAMVLPAYVLLLAAGILSFRRPVAQMILLGAMLVVHGFALANYYFNPRYAREDTRAAARYLESVARTQDSILVVGTKSSMPYYYKGNLSIIYPDDLTRDGQPLAERLQAFNADHGRLWLVQIRPWQTDPMGKVKGALDDRYDLMEHKHFPGVDIYSYHTWK
jgi:uncharacterized membrane protein